ncbi:MAG: hypothetical protein ACRCYQ_10610, partial [Nocardioides sp.]
AVAVISTSGPSYAVCEGDITPVNPESGVVGTLVSAPDTVTDGDPIEGDDARWLETYGPSTQWNTYDLGCGPDLINHPTSIPYTSQSNLALDVALIPVVIANEIDEWVNADPFDFLGPIVTTVQERFGATGGPFWILMPVSIMALGGWMLWRSRSALMHETASTASGALLILAAAMFLLSYPQRANDTFRSALDEGTGIAASAFGETNFADSMFDHVVYPNWLAGELGDPDSGVAKEYGPELYRAQHISYAELAEAASTKPEEPGPGEDEPNAWAPAATALSELSEKKAEDFADIAEKIEEADPAAYRVLTGQDGADTRPGLALQTSAFTWTASAFFILAMIMLGLAGFMIWLFIMTFPIVAMAGIHPRWRPKLFDVINLLAASLIAGFKFMLAAGLYSLIGQRILASPGLSPLVKFLLLLLIAIAGLMILKPVRTLKTFVPGADPNHSYLASGMRRAFNHAVEQPPGATGPREDYRKYDDGPRRTVIAEEDPLPALAPVIVVSPAELDAPARVPEPALAAPGARIRSLPGTGAGMGVGESGGPILRTVRGRQPAAGASGQAEELLWRRAGGDRSGRGAEMIDRDDGDSGWDSGWENAIELAPAESVIDRDGQQVFVLFKTKAG